MTQGERKVTIEYAGDGLNIMEVRDELLTPALKGLEYHDESIDKIFTDEVY